MLIRRDLFNRSVSDRKEASSDRTVTCPIQLGATKEKVPQREGRYPKRPKEPLGALSISCHHKRRSTEDYLLNTGHHGEAHILLSSLFSIFC